MAVCTRSVWCENEELDAADSGNLDDFETKTDVEDLDDFETETDVEDLDDFETETDVKDSSDVNYNSNADIQGAGTALCIERV